MTHAARGRFSGVRFDNFSIGHVARAVLEGVARGFYSFYEDAGSATPTHLRRRPRATTARRCATLRIEGYALIGECQFVAGRDGPVDDRRQC